MPRSSAKRTTAVAPKQPAVAPRFVRPLLLMLAAVLFLLLFSGEIRDTDVFWHLRTGQYIWQTHALPVPDPFSYTSVSAAYPGEELTRRLNLTHEWLSQMVMYLVYTAAGFPGLVLARVVVLIVFCGIVGWMAFRRTSSFYISLAAALGAAGMAFYFQQSRPFLATFLFLAVTMAILESRRWLWLLPPLFLFWANCHSGFFMGWLVCGAYCGEALICRLRRKPVPGQRRLWLVSLVSFLVSGLNPNGFRVVQVLFSYRSSGIQTTNLEWQRPIFWQPGLYSFLLFGSLLVLLFACRRTRPVDWLLYFGFAAISLMAVRNTMFIGLVGPVLIAAYFPRWRAVPAAALITAAAALLVYDVAPAAASRNTLAFRAAEWQLPSGAADFIQARHIADRIFNGYENGGYLIWRLWPLERVFIDGRGLSEEAFTDYRAILYDSTGGKNALRLLQKYGIQILVLEGFDYLSGQVYPLAADLADSPRSEWKLVYADSKGVVIMRHPPPGVAPLDAREALAESLGNQCEQHILHDPLRPRCAFGLSEWYAARGDPVRAREWMALYLARRTAPDPEAERIYQSLSVTLLNSQAMSLQSKGDLGAAESLFRQALAIAEKSLGPNHPDTAGSLNNLASLLESQGNLAAAEPLYRRALAICEKTLGPTHPHTAMSLDNLAGVLAAEGDYASAEPLYRRALDIAEQSLGPDDPTTRTIREDLDGLLQKRGR